MKERLYRGIRSELLEFDQAVLVLEAGRRPRYLAHVGKGTLIDHSPTGYSWGYRGSGPATLALCLLADALDERPSRRQLEEGRARCWQLHQAFKEAVVAGLDQDYGWQLRRSAILDWVLEYGAGAAAPPTGPDAPVKSGAAGAGEAHS